MNFKKLFFSLAMCAILTLPLSAAVHADESYPVLEVAEQGYEEIIPSYDGTLCVAKQNEKYGLINDQGEVLVDFLYDAYTLPNLQGYTIFYKDQTESLPESGWCSNGVYYVDEFNMEYIRDSFLFDKNGILIYSAQKTNFASVNNGILEVRNYSGIIVNESDAVYSVKYLDLYNFEHVLAQYDNVIRSTVFSELYAAIETVNVEEYRGEGYVEYFYKGENARLHIINKNGNEVFDKSFFEILGPESQYGYDVEISNSAMNGTLLCLPIRTSWFSIRCFYFDFTAIPFSLIPDDYLPAEGFNVFTNQNLYSLNYRNRALGDSLTKSLINILTGQVLAEYATISSTAASNLLVKNDSGKWGYIDIWGREKNFYKDAADFINGKALVMDDENRVYMINEKFERISDYLTGVTSVNGMSVRKADGLCYLVKKFGTINDRTGDENRFILAIGDTRAKVWGKYLYNDVAPVIISDRTMLPARFVAENLGAEVGWDETNECVTIKDDKHSIELYIGSNNAKVDGKEVVLDSIPFVANDRTYCPVRFICESLEAKVEWLEDTEEVVIEWK